MEISGLAFDECGVVDTFIILFIEDSENVNITNVTIRNGRGYGLFVQKPHGTFTLSKAKFMYNERNFYFSIVKINAFTILTVTDSVFTHGKSLRRSTSNYSGIELKLLHTYFNVAVHLANIYVADNDDNNIYINYNVCKQCE